MALYFQSMKTLCQKSVKEIQREILEKQAQYTSFDYDGVLPAKPSPAQSPRISLSRSGDTSPPRKRSVSKSSLASLPPNVVIIDLKENKIQLSQRNTISIYRCFIRTNESDILNSIGWIVNESCNHCLVCIKKFSFLRRKHHCRRCGNIICSDCKRKERLPLLEEFGELVVCKTCLHRKESISQYKNPVTQSHRFSSLTRSKIDNFPKYGITLAFLKEFIKVNGGREMFLGMSSYDVCERIIKPVTFTTKTSYCDLMRMNRDPNTDIASVYICHAWNDAFLNILDALEEFYFPRRCDQKDISRANSNNSVNSKNKAVVNNNNATVSVDGARTISSSGGVYSGREEAEDHIVLWLDLFSVNQHQNHVNKGKDWWTGAFMTILSELGQTIVVPASFTNARLLTRSWCLYELYATSKANSNLDMAFSHDNLQDFLYHCHQSDYEITKEILSVIWAHHLNVEDSQSSQDYDKEMILDIFEKKEKNYNKCNYLMKEIYRKAIYSYLELIIDRSPSVSLEFMSRCEADREDASPNPSSDRYSNSSSQKALKKLKRRQELGDAGEDLTDDSSDDESAAEEDTRDPAEIAREKQRDAEIETSIHDSRQLKKLLIEGLSSPMSPHPTVNINTPQKPETPDAEQPAPTPIIADEDQGLKLKYNLCLLLTRFYIYDENYVLAKKFAIKALETCDSIYPPVIHVHNEEPVNDLTQRDGKTDNVDTEHDDINIVEETLITPLKQQAAQTIPNTKSSRKQVIITASKPGNETDPEVEAIRQFHYDRLVFTVKNILAFVNFQVMKQAEREEAIIAERAQGQEQSAASSSKHQQLQLKGILGPLTSSKSHDDVTTEATSNQQNTPSSDKDNLIESDNHSNELPQNSAKKEGYTNDYDRIYQKSLELFGPDDILTLQAMTNLALYYFYLAEKKAAAEEAAEEEQEKENERAATHPEDHSDNMITPIKQTNSVTETVEEIDYSEESGRLFATIYESYHNLLGEYHADTLTALYHIASYYHFHHLYSQAEGSYIACLSGRKKVLGYEHKDSLLTAFSLSKLYYSQEKYHLAEQLALEIYEIYQIVYGEEDSMTLEVMNHLASIYINLRQWRQAEYYASLSYERHKTKYGLEDDNNNSGSGGNNSGNNAVTGGGGSSLGLHSNAGVTTNTTASQQLAHQQHFKNILTTLNLLTSIYYEQKKFDIAEKFYMLSYVKHRHYYGENNRMTLIAMNNVIELYKYQKKYDECEKLSLICYEKRCKILSETHEDTLISLNQLIELYLECKRYNEAEILQRKAYILYSNKYGLYHIYTLTILYSLIYTCSKSSDLDKLFEAEKLAKLTYDKRKVLLGIDHIDTINALHLLGDIFLKIYEVEEQAKEEEEKKKEKEYCGDSSRSKAVLANQIVTPSGMHYTTNITAHSTSTAAAATSAATSTGNVQDKEPAVTASTSTSRSSLSSKTSKKRESVSPVPSSSMSPKASASDVDSGSSPIPSPIPSPMPSSGQANTSSPSPMRETKNTSPGTVGLSQHNLEEMTSFPVPTSVNTSVGGKTKTSGKDKDKDKAKEEKRSSSKRSSTSFFSSTSSSAAAGTQGEISTTDQSISNSMKRTGSASTMSLNASSALLSASNPSTTSTITASTSTTSNVNISSQNRLKEALKCYQRVYDKLKVILGEYHLDTIEILPKLAKIYYYQYSLKSWKKAEEYHIKALDIMLSHYPLQEDLLYTRYAEIITFYTKTQQYASLEKYLKIVYEKRKALFGLHYPKTLESGLKLAEYYEKYPQNHLHHSNAGVGVGVSMTGVGGGAGGVDQSPTSPTQQTQQQPVVTLAYSTAERYYREYYNGCKRNYGLIADETNKACEHVIRICLIQEKPTEEIKKFLKVRYEEILKKYGEQDSHTKDAYKLYSKYNHSNSKK